MISAAAEVDMQRALHVGLKSTRIRHAQVFGLCTRLNSATLPYQEKGRGVSKVGVGSGRKTCAMAVCTTLKFVGNLVLEGHATPRKFPRI